MVTTNIAIYGKSGHGKVVADIAIAIGYENILWIDDDQNKPNCMSPERFQTTFPDTPVALGVGSNAARAKVLEKILRLKLPLVTLIHPSATVSPSASIGSGSVVMPHVVINADAKIATGCIINTAVVIEHDNIIEDYVHISPGAALAGNVTVGSLSHIGIGASIIQGITIASECLVAAGSVLTCNLPSNVMAAGAPAVIKKEYHA